MTCPSGQSVSGTSITYCTNSAWSPALGTCSSTGSVGQGTVLFPIPPGARSLRTHAWLPIPHAHPFQSIPPPLAPSCQLPHPTAASWQASQPHSPLAPLLLCIAIPATQFKDLEPHRHVPTECSQRSQPRVPIPNWYNNRNIGYCLETLETDKHGAVLVTVFFRMHVV